MAEALAPFAPDLGGRTCAHEDDWADCLRDDCGFNDTQPRPGAMPVLQHLILLTSVTDMAAPGGDQPVMCSVEPVGQPGYVGRGLAHDYLHGL